MQHMTASALRVRRATVEDLETLRPLWTSMKLPVSELEPRLTEFQVVENADGKVLGGIGLQITGGNGRLHSEGFTDFAIADQARELLWGRIQTLASNHGIFRVWAGESVPFWTGIGFKKADAEALKKLPEAWKREDSSWFTLQLKDEAAIASVEKELAMFMAAEKRSSDRVFQQARTVKMLANLLALILFAFALGAGIYLLIKKPELLHPTR
jgi:N-acetylglutamate synthase-like GNAT family acetyltransferase